MEEGRRGRKGKKERKVVSRSLLSCDGATGTVRKSRWTNDIGGLRESSMQTYARTYTHGWKEDVAQLLKQWGEEWKSESEKKVYEHFPREQEHTEELDQRRRRKIQMSVGQRGDRLGFSPSLSCSFHFFVVFWSDSILTNGPQLQETQKQGTSISHRR